MQTRRDQVQAHSFVTARLVSAMLRAEPDSPAPPHRRFVVGWICGLIVGLLVVAACGIYGVIVPGGSTEWKTPGALIVEKETGTRYVYLDEQLRPIANYTSARLLLGGDLVVVRVSHNSLAGVPHGLPVGIEAAPEQLPDPAHLAGTHWLVCSSLRVDATGAKQTYVTLTVASTGGGKPLGDGDAVVVRAPDGALYLAWHDRRLRIPSVAQLGILGYAAAPQYVVGWAWLNAVPPGPDLAAPDIPSRGQPGPVIGGTRSTVGQLFDLAGGGGSATQHFVVLTDGLSPVTATGAALLLADVRTRQAYLGGTVRALPLAPSGLADGPMSRDQTVNPLHPVTPPKAVEVATGQAPCVEVTMDATNGPQARIALGPAAAPDLAPPVVALRTRNLADRVIVEPDSGLLIQDQPAPGVSDGALHLLVDTGVRYPVATADVAKLLGYGAVTPVPVPAALLDLIPAGRTLSVEAARATLPAAIYYPAGGGASGAAG